MAICRARISSRREEEGAYRGRPVAQCITGLRVYIYVYMYVWVFAAPSRRGVYTFLATNDAAVYMRGKKQEYIIRSEIRWIWYKEAPKQYSMLLSRPECRLIRESRERGSTSVSD